VKYIYFPEEEECESSGNMSFQFDGRKQLKFELDERWSREKRVQIRFSFRWKIAKGVTFQRKTKKHEKKKERKKELALELSNEK
jgi:hypothetical protein